MESGLKEPKKQSRGCQRCLIILCVIFLAAAIALAVALGVTMVQHKNDDNNNDNQGNNDSHQGDNSVCMSPTCVEQAGQLLDAMNLSADPCTDFYQYSCGGWLKANTIPSDKSSYGRFTEIDDSITLQLQGLLERPFDSKTENQAVGKVKSFYQSCIDEDRLNKLDKTPAVNLIQSLGGLPLASRNHTSSIDFMQRLLDLAKYGSLGLFDVGVTRDSHNSSSYAIYLDQTSLPLSQEYYLKQAPNDTEISAYRDFLRSLAVNVLEVPNDDNLTKDINETINFQIQIAKMLPTLTERRDEEKFYKKTTIRDFQAQVPNFNITSFLVAYFNMSGIKISETTEIILYSEKFLITLFNQTIMTTDERVMVNFIMLDFLHGVNGFLSQKYRDLSLPLNKVLFGIVSTPPRWKACVSNSVNNLPLAAGRLYVGEYFTARAKEKAVEMVGYLRKSMREMIDKVNWMDAETKRVALDKADAIVQKIGYPDDQYNDTALNLEYDGLNLASDTYFANRIAMREFNLKKNVRLLNTVPDRKEWSISAAIVNAFYAPLNNDITFPAGILHPPFYSEDFPASMTFGGIGVVIGHEITHAFDDQGRKYNKIGDLVPWWSNSSVEKFENLAKCYSDYYSSYMEAGLHVNGNLTLGENIADNGGLKASYQAFLEWQTQNPKNPVLPGLGLTHPQLFFLNFAQVWCGKTTDAGAKNRIYTDPHSPASVRVLATLSLSPDFTKAFNCPANSKMNPANKCYLW